jgi:hypothetical protein
VTTSRIDELQRLHEAATKHSNLPWIWTDWNNDWPAIHRVLVAAREFADRRAKQADTFWQWGELREALRALDGGA